MTTQIHPSVAGATKSLPITPGWSHIGPRYRKGKPPTQKEVNKAFKVTQSKLACHRLRKLQQKLGQGKVGPDEAVIGMLDCLMAVKGGKGATK